MKKTELTAGVEALFSTCPGNSVSSETALLPELAGLTMYDLPLIGFAAADDPIFQTYQNPEIIGPWHMMPADWLSGASTVISLFLPFTEAVRLSNRRQRTEPSPQWLHARIEGQAFINAFTRQIRDWLTAQGYGACVPALDDCFVSAGGRTASMGQNHQAAFTSNWSERHVAYACGLGTFGLSKGLITEKGMAGRFCSLITTLPMEPSQRPYSGIYDYCTMCGACVHRCPAQAISLEKGKDHLSCSDLQNLFMTRFEPRYGCGLCQTGVPCEYKIPKPRVKSEIHA